MQELRPYQTEALAAVREAMAADPACRVVVAMPTGTGKTSVFARLIAESGRRALVLAHRRELISQAVSRLAGEGIPACAVLRSDPDPAARCWVASVQTLAASPRRLASMDPELVVVDEAHHACARTYREILDSFPGRPGIGFTATPTRASRREKAELRSVFPGGVVYSMDLPRAVRGGWLARVEYWQAVTSLDLSGVSSSGGDYAQGELEECVDVRLRNEACVVKCMECAPGKTVAFAAGVGHSRHLTECFREAGYRAYHVEAGTPEEERDRILAEFEQAGHLDRVALSNCGVLTEGWDCPDIRTVLLARPTKSPVLYLQMVGRGMRTAPGKAACAIVDCVDGDGGGRGGTRCLLAETAFGLARDLPEGPVRVPRVLPAEETETGGKPPEEADDAEMAFSRPFSDPREAFAVPRELLSSAAWWIPAGDGVFSVSPERGKTLFVVETAAGWDVSGVGPGGRRRLGTFGSAGEAESFAVGLLRRHWASSEWAWSRRMAERCRGRPVSEGQAALLRRMGIDFSGMDREAASLAISARFARRANRK